MKALVQRRLSSCPGRDGFRFSSSQCLPVEGRPHCLSLFQDHETHRCFLLQARVPEVPRPHGWCDPSPTDAKVLQVISGTPRRRRLPS